MSSSTTSLVFLTSGIRNQCHKICNFTNDPTISSPNNAKMLSLRILNSKGYNMPMVDDVLISFDGKICSERVGNFSGAGNVYINTYKYGSRIVVDKNGKEVEVYEVDVYLFSENYSDNWELYLSDEHNIGDITPIKITAPEGQSEVPEDRTLIASTKTGVGCVGEISINNQKVLAGTHMGINIKFPPTTYDPPLLPAKGDGETDDTEAIQACYNKLKAGETLIIPPGNYLISNLTFNKSEVHIDCRGWLMQEASATGAAVVLGGYPTIYKAEATLSIKKQTRNWTQDNIGVKLLNMRQGIFTVDIEGFTRNLVLEAHGSGCSGNTINIKRLLNGKNSIAFKVHSRSNDQNEQSWANENKFYNGVLYWDTGLPVVEGEKRYHIYMPEAEPPLSPARTYQPDNNVFFSPCLESHINRNNGSNDDDEVAIYCNGQRNHFYSPRLEMWYGEPIVHFGPNSFKNQLIYPWHSYDILTPGKYHDEGIGNHIYGDNIIFLNDTQVRPHNIRIRGLKSKTSIPGQSSGVDWGSSGLVDVAPKVTKNSSGNDLLNNNEKLWIGKKNEKVNNVLTEVETSSIDALGNAKFASVNVVQSGYRNNCFKIAAYTYKSDIVSPNTAGIMHLRIINSKSYQYPGISDVMINQKGEMFAETKYSSDLSTDVYIATYQCNYEEIIEDNKTIIKYDIEVYLFSDKGADSWELQSVSLKNLKLDVVGIKTDLSDLPTGTLITSYVPDGRALIANSKTGEGCIGGAKINNKKIWHDGNLPVRVNGTQLQFYDGTTWKTLQTV